MQGFEISTSMSINKTLGFASDPAPESPPPSAPESSPNLIFNEFAFFDVNKNTTTSFTGLCVDNYDLGAVGDVTFDYVYGGTAILGVDFDWVGTPLVHAIIHDGTPCDDEGACTFTIKAGATSGRTITVGVANLVNAALGDSGVFSYRIA